MDVAERIRAAADDGRVTVANVLDALGSRSHFSMIFVIAMTAATPLSGIPGVSMACGLLIALVAAERIVLRGEIRLPKKLRGKSISEKKVHDMLDKLQPAMAFVDRHTRRRLGVLFKPPLHYLPLLICLASGLTMPFLEFIPFSSSIVATGVVFISLAYVTRDGLIALFSVIPYLGLGYLLTRVL